MQSYLSIYAKLEMKRGRKKKENNNQKKSESLKKPCPKKATISSSRITLLKAIKFKVTRIPSNNNVSTSNKRSEMMSKKSRPMSRLMLTLVKNCIFIFLNLKSIYLSILTTKK
jgi:hypothetical protein